MFPPLFWFSEGPQRAGRKPSEVEERTTGCPRRLSLPVASRSLMLISDSTSYHWKRFLFVWGEHFSPVKFSYHFYTHTHTQPTTFTHTHTHVPPLTKLQLLLWVSEGRWYNILVNTVDLGAKQPVFNSWRWVLPSGQIICASISLSVKWG